MKEYIINAGDYRHPITIQQQSITKNEFGEKIATWVDVVSTRASIRPVSGKDYISAVQINSEISHRINFRYLPNLTADMRIMFENRIFTIIAIMNFQEMDKELQLMCKEFL